jgi:hypothetical protein
MSLTALASAIEKLRNYAGNITTTDPSETHIINDLLKHMETLKQNDYRDSAISTFCSAIFRMTLAKDDGKCKHYLFNQVNITDAFAEILKFSIIQKNSMDACGVIWNIYGAIDKPISYTQIEIKILSAMNDILALDRTENIVNALGAFNIMLSKKNDVGEFDFAKFIKNCCILMSNSIKDNRLNVASKLASIIVTFTLNLKVILRGIVRSLVGEFNIIGLLIKCFDKFEDENIRDSCIVAISNFTVSDFAGAFVLFMVKECPEFAPKWKYLVDNINTIKVSDHTRLFIFGAIWNIAESGKEEVAHILVSAGVHLAIFNFVRSVGPDKANWPDTVRKALNFLVNISRFKFVADDLKSHGALDFMRAIANIESNGSNVLKAVIMIAFLEGRQESSDSKASLLQLHPNIVEMLMGVFENTLNSVGGDGYVLGEFCLKLIVRAFLMLSISDSNKPVLATPTLIEKLTRVVALFVDDLPAIQNCGGGVDDIEAIEVTIETMAQLSFLYESYEDLTSKLMQPHMGILGLFKRLVSSPKLSEDAIGQAKLLIARLDLEAQKPPELKQPEAASTGAASHIMLSYCWAKPSRPELVKSLGHELRQAGYEIWRDEVNFLSHRIRRTLIKANCDEQEGSALLPPMSGSTDERMAEAIELSSHIVICVSRAYKERPNCRMEAKYANQMAKKGKVKLLFVMMESDYTTVSTPDCCDGWLGIMLGDALWYPLWDEGQVESATRQLADMIGSSSKIVSGGYGLGSSSPAAPKASTKEAVVIVQPPKTDINYAAAYKLLHTPERMIDSSLQSVQQLLQEWGVLVAEDLGGLLPDDIIALTELLKKAQRKKFLALFKMDMDSSSHEQALVHARLTNMTTQLSALSAQVTSISNKLDALILR